MHPDLEAALRKAGKLRPARADDGRDEAAAPFNGHQGGDEPPAPASEADYGLAPGNETPAPQTMPPLTIAEWLARKLAEEDLISGHWLSTTSRALLVAATGIGKTNFGMAIGMHASAGTLFLHWRGRRPCKVLYIDGEMSRRLLKERIRDAAERLGLQPEGFHALSHEDIEGLAPLNTPAGQACIERLIEHIKPDLIIFDSIMCLLKGDMKDGEAWAQVLPWVKSLTKRCIGQLWIHHTGHDESRSYGDKTKEWQMDTVLHMEKIEREGCDISFSLEFKKARLRTPATRADFQTARIALVGNQWTVEATGIVKPGHASPLGMKFLDALHNALAGDVAEQHIGRRCVSIDLWRAECAAMGLIDAETKAKAKDAETKAKAKSATTLFNKYRRELIGANYVVCNETLAWTVS